MDNIRYALRGVTMEQFATLFEPAGDKIELNVTIPIKTNYEGRSLAVGANIQFIEDGKPFMVAEAFCHYEIEESCWEELSEGRTKDVVLPKEFMDSMARIAIGTIRGAICVKTENTSYSKFCLPIIEIGPAQSGDVFVIPKA
ncbi:MAG: hypothetical protein HUJ98_12920 [Bacteroidaceae bacterium]|nr:hypothetical protein [Bacteroidaceae bacterium]